MQMRARLYIVEVFNGEYINNQANGRSQHLTNTAESGHIVNLIQLKYINTNIIVKYQYV